MILNKRKLQATATEQQVLGFLMSNLDYIHDPRTKLQIDDFDSSVNKVAFDILSGLANEGNSAADVALLRSMAKSHPGMSKLPFEVFEKTIGALYEGRASFDFSPMTFINNIEVLKKYRVLRELQKHDFDVTAFIGEDNVIGQSVSKELEKASVSEIVSYYRDTLSNIEDSLSFSKVRLYADAADGLTELIEKYKTTPAVGALLDGSIFNAISRGARFGKLFMNSAPTGAGKSRMMLGSAASLSMPYINDEGLVVVKSDGYSPVLFIPTEQDYTEIQSMLLAHVSGVNEESIQIGRTSFEEDIRIRQAAKIIEEYRHNFHIEQIPDPSISSVKNTLIKHINRFKIEYIFYDYIFSSPALTQEFSNSRVREDVALIYMANALKEIATTQNVFIMSSTQLTGEWMKAETRSTNLIRGSRGLADKIDLGAITVKISGEELKNVQSIVEELGGPAPTLVTDIYKNRAGSLEGIKIFRYFDHGTCRLEDLFMTDQYYTLKTGYHEYFEETYTETIEEHLKRREKEHELDGN